MTDDWTPEVEVTGLARVKVAVREDTGRNEPLVEFIADFTTWLYDAEDAPTSIKTALLSPTCYIGYFRIEDVDRIVEWFDENDIPRELFHTGSSEALGYEVNDD